MANYMPSVCQVTGLTACICRMYIRYYDTLALFSEIKLSR